MGRKRQKVEEQPMMASLSIYSRYMATKTEEQRTGKHYYGEAINSVNDREAGAVTFYPFQLQPPPPPVKLPVFQPEQFHVEHADPTLLSITMPMLLQQLMDSVGPAPNPKHGPPISANEEKAVVERMRKEGRSWQHISIALGGTKTASSLRKRYNASHNSGQGQPSSGGLQPSVPPGTQHPSATMLSASHLHPRSATPPASGLLRAPSPVAIPLSLQQRADSGGSTESRTPTAAAAAQRDPRRAAAVGAHKADSTPTQPMVQLPPAVPSSRMHDLVNGIRVADMINFHATNRAGGDERVTLKKMIKRMPEGFSGMHAHGLKSLAGVKFYEEVFIQDPDDPERTYYFNIHDRVHCPCFHIGEGADGSPLLSWSDIFVLYQLPDGSKWAEHGYYNDAEDLEQLGRRLGRSHQSLLPSDMGKQELLRRKGRYHSRLQNIEYECWIYQGGLPQDSLPCPPDEAFYWRHTFDPYTLARVD